VEAFFFVLFFSLSLVNIFSLGIEGLDCSFPSFFPRQVYQSTDGVLLKNRIELRVLHHIDIPPSPIKYEWKMEARRHALSSANNAKI
jgi:hypothetical protein